MRNTYQISFVDLKQSLCPYTPKWWDRPRWFVVRLLGGECPYDTVKVTTFPIDGDDFADRLFRQKRALFDTFGKEAQVILIGGEDYRDLMSSPEVIQSFSFMSSFNYNRQVFGMEVKVIPWMSGILAIPKGFLEDMK